MLQLIFSNSLSNSFKSQVHIDVIFLVLAVHEGCANICTHCFRAIKIVGTKRLK